MRPRHKPWADDFINENNQIVELNPSIKKGKWKEIFLNEKPIHLEIGTGKGQFITGMANQHSDYNFIGIEVAKSVLIGAIRKVKQEGTNNIRLINENAQDLRQFFLPNEVSTIYLNFSDPWPKKRHEKRRLTFKTFLEQYEEVLKDQGQLILKTDNRSLFEYSLISFSQYGMVLDEVSLNLHAIGDETNIKTEYEEKFSKDGPIYRCKAHFVSKDM